MKLCDQKSSRRGSGYLPPSRKYHDCRRSPKMPLMVGTHPSFRDFTGISHLLHELRVFFGHRTHDSNRHNELLLSERWVVTTNTRFQNVLPVAGSPILPSLR